jgi:hypothetical protein
MPIPTILIIAASAAGGALLFSSLVKAKTEDDAARQNAANQAASQLDKGKTYVVQLMVDPRSPQWGGLRDLTTASNLIRVTLEQLGWKFLMNPMPRESSVTASAKLAALQPLEWVFNGTWMKDEKFMSGAPTWVGMALPYPIPTS